MVRTEHVFLKNDHMRKPPYSGRFILYDYFQVAGGAERVTVMLAEGFADYRVVISRCYPDFLHMSGKESINAISLSSGVDRWFGRIASAMLNFRFRTSFLRDAETVLYSGFYTPLAVKNQRSGQKIYYCHTPPRYLYDLRDVYLARASWFMRPMLKVFFGLMRREYELSLHQMDQIIANSHNVQGRLKKYLGLDSVVIYPPVDVERFHWLGTGDYYLSLARLEPNKRVDVIVEAFRKMPDKRLVVASGGSENERLRQLANGVPNIHFTGWQTEAQLLDWIGNALAAIYVPVDEDFGMSPIEAMAAGKPVIGVAEGGLLETIVDGETGFLLPAPVSVSAMCMAVNRLSQDVALEMRGACEARAQMFSKEIFLGKMRDVISGSNKSKSEARLGAEDQL